MVDFDFDAVVVGAGAVGLACGYALGQRGLTVAVLEKDAAIGQGVSSRNSEVVHGGIYYPTGSLKARLCVEGRRRLYAFCDRHHVEYDRCGKLVVAESEADLARLDTIMAQAQTNDVEGMAVLTRAQALALEPELAPTLYRAREAGQPVDVAVSGIAADSLGAKRIGAIAWDVTQQQVKDALLLPDAAIRAAQLWLWTEFKLAVEPAAALGLAALQTGAYAPRADEKVCLVICGANVDPATLAH